MPTEPTAKVVDLPIGRGRNTDGSTPGGKAAPSDVIIDIRKLGLTFQTADAPVVALSNIDLAVRAGEFVSLIGPSGCGKTTLMRIVADLEQPTEGTVTVNGVSPREARLKRAYGYIFQAAALYPWRNVQRNVELPHEIMGVSREEREAKAARYLELVGLKGFEKKFPWQLSGGMQQRVSIARALSFDPQLLLMDEPFGALDEITRDRMNEELLQIWGKTRKTVIFVTHSIDEAVLLSTKIVVMSARPGRIVDVIDSTLPGLRTLETRETPAAHELAHRVRLGLKAGHSYD
ncbi:MAG TPA: ABC transporter ATP-binding protein [Dongiaceae bacterium]|jgi:NitT/TauT family transport system ATP-binding protein